MRSDLHNELQARLDRQEAFLASDRPGFLAFATYRGMYRDIPAAIEDWPGIGSAEFITARSAEMGRHKWHQAVALFERHLAVGDDSVLGWASPTIDWGTGATASMFTGLTPIFQKDTSYSPRHVVESPADIDTLSVDLHNPWIGADVDYWRGFFDVCDGPIPVTVHNYRSPLDLANDLRGNDIFIDMVDRPEAVDRLLDWCTDSIIAVDTHIRQCVPALQTHPSGCWGVARPAPGMLFLNGDPVDLVSVEMGERFNHPYVQRLARYAAGGVYFHHHSIGIDRATSVSTIDGLTVQEFIQDPNGPRIPDEIDDDLVAASMRVPIDLHSNAAAWDRPEELLHRMSHGRFILRAETDTLEQARRWVEKIRGYHR